VTTRAGDRCLQRIRVQRTGGIDPFRAFGQDLRWSAPEPKVAVREIADQVRLERPLSRKRIVTVGSIRRLEFLVRETALSSKRTTG
jgi:hypothetical protein